MADQFDAIEISTRRSADSKSSGDVKSALRVIDVLDLLGRRHAERTHNQIAEELNIPKSSLTQILQTLVRHEYLSFNLDTKGYALGPAIDKLSAGARVTKDLVSVSGSVLSWLTAETTESSALNFIVGDELEVVATQMSPQRVLAHLRLGDRAPLHSTSGGQAMLAFLGETQLNSYLERVRFEKYARNTLMSVGEVRAKLERIRKDGYAIVNEEFTPGVGGISRPIFDADGNPIASIGITVPVTRFSEQFRNKAGDMVARAVLSLGHRAGLT